MTIRMKTSIMRGETLIGDGKWEERAGQGLEVRPFTCFQTYRLLKRYKT